MSKKYLIIFLLACNAFSNLYARFGLNALRSLARTNAVRSLLPNAVAQQKINFHKIGVSVTSKFQARKPRAIQPLLFNQQKPTPHILQADLSGFLVALGLGIIFGGTLVKLFSTSADDSQLILQLMQASQTAIDAGVNLAKTFGGYEGENTRLHASPSLMFVKELSEWVDHMDFEKYTIDHYIADFTNKINTLIHFKAQLTKRTEEHEKSNLAHESINKMKILTKEIDILMEVLNDKVFMLKAHRQYFDFRNYEYNIAKRYKSLLDKESASLPEVKAFFNNKLNISENSVPAMIEHLNKEIHSAEYNMLQTFYAYPDAQKNLLKIIRSLQEYKKILSASLDSAENKTQIAKKDCDNNTDQLFTQPIL